MQGGQGLVPYFLRGEKRLPYRNCRGWLGERRPLCLELQLTEIRTGHDASEHCHRLLEYTLTAPPNEEGNRNKRNLPSVPC